jgi:hypothetical protein
MEEINDVTLSREVKEAENEKKLDMEKTSRYKNKLVNDIKNGLGNEIKKNPSKVKIIKKTWSQKLFANLRKIFTKF